MSALAYRDVLVFDDEGVLKENTRLSLRPTLRLVRNRQAQRASLSILRTTSRRSTEPKS